MPREDGADEEGDEDLTEGIPLSVSFGLHHGGDSYGPVPSMFELCFFFSLRSATPKV